MNHLSRKPRYGKAAKEHNRQAMEAFVSQKAGWIPIWRSRIHVTLQFDNGRRLECYPTTLGLHNQGSWLRYYTVSNLQKEIARFAAMPPDPKDDPATQKGECND